MPSGALSDVHGTTSRTFGDVYAARLAPSVRTAALITGSREVAEELAHDAFIDLLRHWDEVREPDAWLRTAVVHRCRSWQRRHILERERTPLPDTTCADADGLAVRQALAVLSPRQRAAVVLRWFDDLPEAEIAAALGCRPGTVKSLLSRALPKLQEALRD